MERRTWTIGESVAVRAGVRDPDTGSDISGWQGRISAIRADEELILTIQWDSLTLKSMPTILIAWSEEEGLVWSEMNLPAADMVPAAARDTEDEVTATIAEIAAQTSWLYLGGEQGQRIQQIVNRAEDDDDYSILRIWHAYLEEHLVVPFAATVAEYQCGPVRQGDRVGVMGVTGLDESYGTIVGVKHKHGVYELPLSDLKATEADAQTRQLVDDYAVWFANR